MVAAKEEEDLFSPPLYRPEPFSHFSRPVSFVIFSSSQQAARDRMVAAQEEDLARAERELEGRLARDEARANALADAKAEHEAELRRLEQAAIERSRAQQRGIKAARKVANAAAEEVQAASWAARNAVVEAQEVGGRGGGVGGDTDDWRLAD